MLVWWSALPQGSLVANWAALCFQPFCTAEADRQRQAEEARFSAVVAREVERVLQAERERQSQQLAALQDEVRWGWQRQGKHLSCVLGR